MTANRGLEVGAAVRNEGIDVDSRVYRTLLESTRAIPWQIDWKTASFSYIGPQIEPLLGWPAGSWKLASDWAERMHPDDRQWVVDYCMAQSASGIDHEADYRALTADGRYVWIRDVVHVIRDDAGEVTSLVGFMFDISERKASEQRIEELQHELMALSYQDGLTGLANRRRFDEALAEEWARAGSSGQPLSLVLCDIDHFKAYNDHYGHLEGDACLKAVASVLKHVATRPADVVARYGGEEFALLLPNTARHEAMAVAERCRRLLSEAGIAHASNPDGPVVSMSFGVVTRLTDDIGTMHDFVARVDGRLYNAKASGRGVVVA